MLEISQLAFSYADDTELMEFSLAANPGEVLSIIGPSGAGKTTLINLIAGFLPPQSGDIVVDGESLITMPVAERPVSMVFQQFNLFPHLDVFSNVALGLRASLKLSGQERDRIGGVLETLGLSALEKRLPPQLSGGQQQRVALARAMVRDRRVLLLDEAFTALGPALRLELLQLVRQLVNEHQMMAIAIGHQPADVPYISDKLAFIDRGHVIKQGAVGDILDNPQDPVISQYLGPAEQ